MEKKLDKGKIKKFMKNIGLISILAIIVILYKKDYIKLPQKPEKKVVEIEDQGVPIEVEEVKKEDLIRKRLYTGTIYPKETVELNFKTPGKISALNVKEGDYVKKGAVIATLDGSSLEASLKTMESKKETINKNKEYLKGEEEKLNQLLEGGAIPKSKYDELIHEIDILEMQLKEIDAQKFEVETNKRDLILSTPISGIVKVVNGNVGGIAGGGQPLVIIDHNKDATVKVNISELDLEKIKVGTKVNMNIFGEEKEIKSKVSRIVPNINPKTRIGEVEIQNVNSKKGLIFGSSVPTEFIIDEFKSQETISKNSIKILNDKEVVYKIEEETVREIPIKTGIEENNRVQIIEGVKPGDKLAIGNLDKLYDGAKIYVYKGE